MIQANFVNKLKKHILCSIVFDNHAVYAIMWKDMAEGDKTQMKI